MSATTYHVNSNQEKISVADEEDDWGASPTSVTQMRDEVNEKLAASKEKMEAIARKAERLRRFLNRSEGDYPKIVAVLGSNKKDA
jgi:hypothetical protein